MPEQCNWGTTRDHAAGCEEDALPGLEYCETHQAIEDYTEELLAARIED